MGRLSYLGHTMYLVSLRRETYEEAKWNNKIAFHRFIMRKKALDVQAELEERKRLAQDEEHAALQAKKKAEDELNYKISRQVHKKP